MASKYDEYWITHFDVISTLIQKAQQNGVSRRVDISDIAKYGKRKNWYGDVVVSETGVSKGVMSHARSLGKVVFASGLIKEGKFRFVIGSDLKLRVERLETDKIDDPGIGGHFSPRYNSFSEMSSTSDSISTIFSTIPEEVWDKIVQEEPEWMHMEKFIERYGFGRFAVMMLAAGLNDFLLKGKAEVAYWPRLKQILERHLVPNSPEDLQLILSEFYRKERLPELKLERLNCFISGKLARKLWSATPHKVAKDFLKIWHELASTMKQSKEAKTITFAMKCLGIALLMADESEFSFESIPIPVDYRVREFTKRLGINAENDEEIRTFWNEVLLKLRKIKPKVNMIHLDSLVWQIGVFGKPEIVDYFTKLGLKEAGEKIAECVRW